MKKRLAMILVVVLVTIAFVIPIEARAMTSLETVSGERMVIEPRNTNVHTSSLSLSFSGMTANCSATLIAYTSNTTYVKVKMTLAKYTNGGWSTVQSWSNSADSAYVYLSKSTVVSRGKYRLTCVYTANSEVITKSVEKTL